ncbi:MAG: hypothetical protein WDN24_09830 [Sphingomonas sp.]
MRAARDHLPLAIAAGFPLLLNLLTPGALWQPRQLLPVTPFLAALVTAGIRLLLEDLRGRPALAVRAAVALFVAGVTFAPADRVIGSEGPHSMTGRARGIVLWRQWQIGVGRDMAAIDGAVARARPNATLAIVTDDWDEDRFTHLRLMAAGFRPPAQAGIAPGPCDRVAEPFVRGNQRIVHIPHPPEHVAVTRRLDSPRWDRLGRPCLAQLAPQAAFLVVRAGRLERLGLPGTAAIPELAADRAWRAGHPRLVSLGYSRIAAILLDASRIADLSRGYANEAASRGDGGPAVRDARIRTEEEARAATRSLLPFPG